MKPIIFNTEMVQAILQGRKTVTRRKIKLDLGLADTDKNDNSYLMIPNTDGDYHKAEDYCKYQVGDILYVRETFCEVPYEHEHIKIKDGYITTPKIAYKADSEVDYTGIWKPSIHMPKGAARIFLKVTGVRCERLKDITEEQAKKEGVKVETNNSGIMYRCNFIEFWNSTIKKDDLFKYSWKANPWVYVIDFEVMKGSAINELYSEEYKK